MNRDHDFVNILTRVRMLPANGNIEQIGPRDERETGWRFPSLADCRAVFDQATGTKGDWEAT